MPTIQVLPAEVRKGDRITITGTVEITGGSGIRHQDGSLTVYYQPDGVQCVSLYYHPADQPLTVDRPDPDDDLIEAMARAIVDSDVLDWDELPERDMLGYRANARAALAALREYEAGA